MFKVGDKVRMHKTLIGSIAYEYDGGLIGTVTEVYTDWDDTDMICWDCVVTYPEDRTYGFYFDDLVPA